MIRAFVVALFIVFSLSLKATTCSKLLHIITGSNLTFENIRRLKASIESSWQSIPRLKKEDIDWVRFQKAKQYYSQQNLNFENLPRTIEESLALIEVQTKRTNTLMSNMDAEFTRLSGELDFYSIVSQGTNKRWSKLNAKIKKFNFSKKHTKQQWQEFISDIYLIHYRSPFSLKELFKSNQKRIKARLTRLYSEALVADGLFKQFHSVGLSEQQWSRLSKQHFKLVQDATVNGLLLYSHGVIPMFLSQYTLEPSGRIMQKIAMHGFDKAWPDLVKHHGFKSNLELHYNTLKKIYAVAALGLTVAIIKHQEKVERERQAKQAVASFNLQLELDENKAQGIYAQEKEFYDSLLEEDPVNQQLEEMTSDYIHKMGEGPSQELIDQWTTQLEFIYR